MAATPLPPCCFLDWNPSLLRHSPANTQAVRPSLAQSAVLRALSAGAGKDSEPRFLALRETVMVHSAAFAILSENMRRLCLHFATTTLSGGHYPGSH
jgi:hypothetical protein